MLKFLVDKTDEGIKLFKFVKNQLKNASLGAIYTLFRKKDVKVNNHHEKKDYILKAHDVVVIYGNDEKLQSFLKRNQVEEAMPLPFPIIFEDENLLIINKPQGLLSQGDRSGELSLIEYTKNYFAYKKEDAKVYPLHRLDRNTSGLIAIAKNYHTSQVLSNLMKDHRFVEKIYLALVVGVVSESGEISKNLKKDERTNFVKVDEEGKTAKTLYEVEETFDEVSLLSLTLLSGRGHQLRVHLASIGHPICMDEKYGNFAFNKSFQQKYKLRHIFLHAKSLRFKNIKDEQLQYLNGKIFLAPLPKVEEDIINILRGEKYGTISN